MEIVGADKLSEMILWLGGSEGLEKGITVVMMKESEVSMMRAIRTSGRGSNQLEQWSSRRRRSESKVRASRYTRYMTLRINDV
jgi:hypothetical protein